MASVELTTGSRAHLTLLDMHGSRSGRVDGGVGLMLAEPVVRVRASQADESSLAWSSQASPVRTESGAAGSPGAQPLASDEMYQAAWSALRAVEQGLGVGPVAVEVVSCPPAHVGLGAKTQLGLAVAAAAAHSAGLSPDATTLASLIGRGGTSGIGVHGFQWGGFILDGGHRLGAKAARTPFRPSSASADAGPPPLLARYEFPDWPVLLVTPAGRRIHGADEARLFRKVCPVPLRDVRSLCHVIVMSMLPAIVEHDLAAFGASLWALAQHRWKAFEIRAQAPGVRRLIRRLRHEVCLGGAAMSSWGTSLICVDHRLGSSDGHALVERVRRLMVEETGGGQVTLTKVRNEPATVTAVVPT